jgi:hypothetical protein
MCIGLIVGITMPAIETHDDFQQSTCTFLEEDGKDVYFELDADELGALGTVIIVDEDDDDEFDFDENAVYASGTLKKLLEHDEEYKAGDTEDCWYEKGSIVATNYSSEFVVDSLASWPPPRFCYPIGFGIVCNSSFCHLQSTNFTTVNETLVDCSEVDDEIECFDELAQYFPPNSTFVCFESTEDLLMRLDFSGIWLIVEGFIGVFGLFGVTGLILITLINANARNDANCFGLVDC